MQRVDRHDGEFPVQLLGIPDPPDVLYVRGALVREDALAVAVVGSRRATEYGEGVAEELGAQLAARGITVVSGLARGIDSAAHRGALRAGGRTIAVLGSGVDVVYPPENRRLAARIEASGAVLSQFAPGTPPLPHHFPLRNRVIAGLALAVVVVEAAARSGALITARMAAEFGREVMAVPGRVTSPASRGAHALIRDGATLIESWEDVVAELPARWRECVTSTTGGERAARADDRATTRHGEDAARVLGVLGAEPATMDDIIEKTGVLSGRAAALLLTLELDGHIRRIEGERFVRLGA
ncbi:MAG TPA: DNA-processing protein DprA [Candidatus Methylomirabilis sp.]|nr:DNA-processing protein DprA [Candidatus Methylomirabilis sp.]